MFVVNVIEEERRKKLISWSENSKIEKVINVLFLFLANEFPKQITEEDFMCIVLKV